MKIITPTVLALASTPLTTNAWSMGGPYFTKQIYLPSANIMIQRQRALSNRFFQEAPQIASPRYELIDKDEKFQLSVDVPGVKIEDIDVSMEDGYLTVSGQRSSSNDSSRFTSKFSQTFSLDAAVDVDKFAASLSDGVLVVAAPKDMKRIEENSTKILVVRGRPEAEAVGDTLKLDTTSLVDDDDEEEDDGTETLNLDQNKNVKTYMLTCKSATCKHNETEAES